MTNVLGDTQDVIIMVPPLAATIGLAKLKALSPLAMRANSEKIIREALVPTRERSGSSAPMS
jgi:hypothetical protein